MNSRVVGHDTAMLQGGELQCSNRCG
jgi:hypothetical protein